jgi:hypothetical protein
MRLASWDGSRVRLRWSRIAFSPAFFKPSLTGAIDPIRRLFLSGPLEEFFRMGALKHGPNGPYRHMRCLSDDQFWLFVVPRGTF